MPYEIERFPTPEEFAKLYHDMCIAESDFTGDPALHVHWHEIDTQQRHYEIRVARRVLIGLFGGWAGGPRLEGNKVSTEPTAKWPATFTREQFINAVEEFLSYLDDNDFISHAANAQPEVRLWVDQMDAAEQVWPDEETGRQRNKQANDDRAYSNAEYEKSMGWRS